MLVWERNQTNLQAGKNNNCSCEKIKARPMTNKSIEIHEMWPSVLTLCHKRRLRDWCCSLGQRWTILYWNAKWLLTEWSLRCFKMHETHMEQKRQGRSLFVFLHASLKACHRRCHTTQTQDTEGPASVKGIKCYCDSGRGRAHTRTPVVIWLLLWRCAVCWAWQQRTVHPHWHSSFHVH